MVHLFSNKQGYAAGRVCLFADMRRNKMMRNAFHYTFFFSFSSAIKCIMLQLCNIRPIELPRKPEMSRTAPLESALPQTQLSPDVAVLQDIPAPHLRCLPCACLSTAEFAAWEGFGRVVFVLRVSVAVSWGPRICSTLVQISVLHEIAIVTLSQIPSDRTWPLLVCKGSSFSFPSFFPPSFPSHMCLCLECQPHVRRTGEVSASLWVFLLSVLQWASDLCSWSALISRAGTETGLIFAALS